MRVVNEFKMAMAKLAFYCHDDDCVCEHGEPCTFGDCDQRSGEGLCSMTMCPDCKKARCDKMSWDDPCKVSGTVHREESVDEQISVSSAG